MYTVTLLNLITGKQFEKMFDSYYRFKLFMNKCKYSKKVKVVSFVKEY